MYSGALNPAAVLTLVNCVVRSKLIPDEDVRKRRNRSSLSTLHRRSERSAIVPKTKTRLN
jgi:hypothetical protein